jgi:hypothetical protein
LAVALNLSETQQPIFAAIARRRLSFPI